MSRNAIASHIHEKDIGRITVYRMTHRRIRPIGLISVPPIIKACPTSIHQPIVTVFRFIIKTKNCPRALFAAFGCIGILLFSTGCEEEPQIVQHRIPKSQSGLEAFRSGPASSSTSATAQTTKALPGPEGWKREKSNPMFPSDKFSKVVDENEVVLSVMSLPASNDWQSNIQRWLGQVSMKMTPAEVDQITTEVEVDGITSKKIRLFKDDDVGDAIVGVMAVKGNLAWFIKLMGAKDAVESTEKEFDDYISSFKFP